jgi:ABC-2 type transport system permease protein
VRLVLVHARANLLQLARYPTFAVPTLLFPALLFAFFGLTQSNVRANVLMASFAAYAVLSVAFFQFGVGIASDRVDPWETYVRTLPAGAGVRFPARLSGAEWARFAFALLAGGIPLALLGIAVGYWVPPKGALAVANLLYLGFAYAGGLWTGPHGLPDAVESAAPFVPTRQWGDVVWAAVEGGPWGGIHWLALTGYGLLFGILAVIGYRRDEGERFG